MNQKILLGCYLFSLYATPTLANQVGYEDIIQHETCKLDLTPPKSPFGDKLQIGSSDISKLTRKGYTVIDSYDEKAEKHMSVTSIKHLDKDNTYQVSLNLVNNRVPRHAGVTSVTLNQRKPKKVLGKFIKKMPDCEIGTTLDPWNENSINVATQINDFDMSIIPQRAIDINGAPDIFEVSSLAHPETGLPFSAESGEYYFNQDICKALGYDNSIGGLVKDQYFDKDRREYISSISNYLLVTKEANKKQPYVKASNMRKIQMNSNNESPLLEADKIFCLKYKEGSLWSRDKSQSHNYNLKHIETINITEREELEEDMIFLDSVLFDVEKFSNSVCTHYGFRMALPGSADIEFKNFEDDKYYYVFDYIRSGDDPLYNRWRNRTIGGHYSGTFHAIKSISCLYPEEE